MKLLSFLTIVMVLFATPALTNHDIDGMSLGASWTPDMGSGQTMPVQLAQNWDGKQCCECCFDGVLKKDCVFMETNKCRARGGVCNGGPVPCFGRD